MKVILVLGILTFLFLLLTSYALKRTLKPNELERVVIRQKYSPFDSQRAFKDLSTIVAFGPRPAGAPESAKLREFLKHELTMKGIRCFEHAFEADTPAGKKSMVNLVAVIEGTRSETILIGNHYDTKLFKDFPFIGANDGGSTSAWMLEMARSLGPRRDGRTLWLAWFDGEEAVAKWSDTDGLYGSKALVKHLQENREIANLRAMINVDMIGDTYLGIQKDKNAAQWLQDIFWDTARRLGYQQHFGRLAGNIQDDDFPFRQAGIPSLLLIDFSYGGSILEHQQNWHTANDTLENVSAASLQAVADVFYHALPAIDGYLDQHPRNQD
ncbi:MAG TPA: M28 family peptidase [Candidatus Hydrogenedentes bacterium]|nr:M28 family peptidase [Candidatus Hydrogenedentota bacterium]